MEAVLVPVRAAALALALDLAAVPVAAPAAVLEPAPEVEGRDGATGIHMLAIALETAAQQLTADDHEHDSARKRNGGIDA
jgi:hypothetical protein